MKVEVEVEARSCACSSEGCPFPSLAPTRQPVKSPEVTYGASSVGMSLPRFVTIASHELNASDSSCFRDVQQITDGISRNDLGGIGMLSWGVSMRLWGMRRGSGAN